MSTEDQQTITRRVADAVAPAVVRIGRHGGRGCGVVVADGLVATNAHNLRDRTTEVTFADGRVVQGRATGVAPDGEIAGPSDLEAALADPDLATTVTVHVVRGSDELDLVVTFATEEEPDGETGEAPAGAGAE